MTDRAYYHRYVQSLETRLDKMDRLFNKVSSSNTCTLSLPDSQTSASQFCPGLDVNAEIIKLDQEDAATTGDESVEHLPRNDNETSALASDVVQMALFNPSRPRFFGKSR